MNPKHPERLTREPERDPMMWFALLVRARRTDDRALMDRAIEALDRLGVVVEFRSANPPVKGGEADE